MNVLPAIALAVPAAAQYGAFDPKIINGAAALPTLVVLDDGNSGYNAMVMNAMKADWKFTTELDFINTADLATQPLDPAKNYLMRIQRKDAEKHDAVFLALVAGWKQKKDEALVVENGAVINIPPAQELASIMVDYKALGSDGSAMAAIYCKHLQDYLRNVQKGTIKDKATADRLYAGRNKRIKEMNLYMPPEHLDKTVPDANKAKETYTHALEIVDRGKSMVVVESGEAGIALSDVVITGSDKTKWCFKRIFDINTGELLYLRDDAALFGKKEGFITEDFRMLEQSR